MARESFSKDGTFVYNPKDGWGACRLGLWRKNITVQVERTEHKGKLSFEFKRVEWGQGSYSLLSHRESENEKKLTKQELYNLLQNIQV